MKYKEQKDAVDAILTTNKWAFQSSPTAVNLGKLHSAMLAVQAVFNAQTSCELAQEQQFLAESSKHIIHAMGLV